MRKELSIALNRTANVIFEEAILIACRFSRSEKVKAENAFYKSEYEY